VRELESLIGKNASNPQVFTAIQVTSGFVHYFIGNIYFFKDLITDTFDIATTEALRQLMIRRGRTKITDEFVCDKNGLGEIFNILQKPGVNIWHLSNDIEYKVIVPTNLAKLVYVKYIKMVSEMNLIENKKLAITATPADDPQDLNIKETASIRTTMNIRYECFFPVERYKTGPCPSS